jgi:hypothetical protein
MTTVYQCKVSGCEKMAHWTRGRYAFMCVDHANKKRVEEEGLDPIKSSTLSKFPKLPLTLTTPPSFIKEETSKPEISLVDASKKLVPIAKKLELSAKAKRKAHHALIKDATEFNDILAEIKKAANSLISGTTDVG